MKNLNIHLRLPGQAFKGIARQLAGLVILSFVLTGCAGKIVKATNQFYAGRPQAALELLSKEDEFSDRDKLLLYMEKGAILHDTGKYEESIQVLLKASNLIKEQDVVRVGNESASLVVNEWMTEYKGEYSERLWVHTYLMMDFLMIGKYESALVEAKQALKVLDENKEPLERDHFSRAMIAMCYENLGELNDAYIEYKRLAKALSDPSPVAPQLYRLALELGFQEDAEKYKEFIKPTKKQKGATAEAIIFVGLGHGPVKVAGNIVIPPSIRFSFPRYENASDRTASVAFFKSSKHIFGKKLKGLDIVTNMNGLAKSSLKDRAASIIAKETIRAAAKETIARAVSRNNDTKAVGLLVRLVLMLLEEPDTRCWRTLPARQNLFRLPLTPGHQKITAFVYSEDGQVIRRIELPEFDIAKGQKRFFSLRFGEAISFLGNQPAEN